MGIQVETCYLLCNAAEESRITCYRKHLHNYIIEILQSEASTET